MSAGPLDDLHSRAGLRYLTGGSGAPLVLCHGFLGSAENFDTWMPSVCERRRVVIPDLPGCGGSPPLRGVHRADAMASAVLGLVDELGLQRFDLGGLCLGATVACAVVRRRPRAVERLLLHTPLLEPALVRWRFHAQARFMTAPGVFAAVQWLMARRRVSDLYKRLMVEGNDVDPVAATQNFDNQVRADKRANREWLLDGLRRNDRAMVTQRPEPTLLLVAADDAIADVPALRAAKRARGVQLAVIEDAGHGWNPAYVRRQLAVITAFLDGEALPSGSRAA